LFRDHLVAAEMDVVGRVWDKESHDTVYADPVVALIPTHAFTDTQWMRDTKVARPGLERLRVSEALCPIHAQTLAALGS